MASIGITCTHPSYCHINLLFSSLTTPVEYFLEDAIEMLHFIPPPQEKKKKKPQGEREAYEMEADVSQIETRGYLLIFQLLVYRYRQQLAATSHGY